MEHPIVLRGISAVGLLVMLLLAWGLSERRDKVPWRVLIWGTILQFLMALLVLRTPFGRPFFDSVNQAFDVLTEASDAGARLLFGNLGQLFLIDGHVVLGPDGQPISSEPFPIKAMMAFHVLPVIIFVSGVAAVLQHLGVIQAVIQGMAWLMRRTLKTSGAETFGAGLQVFTGIESMSALRGYVNTMTRSEMFSQLVTFLATIAASVMVAYAGFGAEPGHLLAASLMNAPAALVMAKLMIPETGKPETSGDMKVTIPVDSHNIFDAAARGGAIGLEMALNVGALLIVFVGSIYLVDWLAEAILGFSLTAMMSWVMWPFAFLMGVPWSDIPEVARLVAVKSVFNEFIAYSQMQPLLQQHVISDRSGVIATYALCGFSNPGSLGIMIGAIGALAPNRRDEVAQLSLKALIAGTLTCFSTACVAGILT